jgi:hypothetical protein
MIETVVKTRSEVDAKGVDLNFNFLAIKVKSGKVISKQWFIDYVGASLWCLENCI